MENTQLIVYFTITEIHVKKQNKINKHNIPFIMLGIGFIGIDRVISKLH